MTGYLNRCIEILIPTKFAEMIQVEDPAMPWLNDFRMSKVNGIQKEGNGRLGRGNAMDTQPPMDTDSETDRIV